MTPASPAVLHPTAACSGVQPVTTGFSWSPGPPLEGQPVQFTDESLGTTACLGDDMRSGYSEYISVGVDPLEADFEWSPRWPGHGEVVQFTDTSTGEVVSRRWSFGDGGWPEEQNPSHTYAMPGRYEVPLRVSTTLSGLTDTAVRTVIVTKPWKMVFIDGFESGDATRWSVSYPLQGLTSDTGSPAPPSDHGATDLH